MKRMPTTAKVSASRRRARTTKRSAVSPCMARDSNWPAGQVGAARRVLSRIWRHHPLRGRLRRLLGVVPPNPRHPPRGTVAVDCLESAAVIEREQVLHVAKLARLGLSGAEVERMAGELSGILEHVDRIAELDLDDVEPTSHVVELENVWRADVPHESLEPEV